MDRPFISLKVLYENLPVTSGCENCVSINNDNAYWCCKSYVPSMFYVEFLYIWKTIINKTDSEKKSVILNSIKNYLLDSQNKKCPFWDDKCSVYEVRPFSCREYGIIPDEIWADRVSYLKKIHGENYEYKNQCSLVKIDKGNNNKELSNKRFQHIQKCEIEIGADPIKTKNYTDENSTYRVAHDHILLELFDNNFLKKLTEFKLSKPTENEIDDFISALLGALGDGKVSS